MLHLRQKAVVNKYPLWKYIAILVIVILAVIYALPNLFGETPSLQISPKDGTVNAEFVTQVRWFKSDLRMLKIRLWHAQRYKRALAVTISLRLIWRQIRQTGYWHWEQPP